MNVKEAKEILDRAKDKSYIDNVRQEPPANYMRVIPFDELREIIWDMLTRENVRS